MISQNAPTVNGTSHFTQKRVRVCQRCPLASLDDLNTGNMSNSLLFVFANLAILACGQQWTTFSGSVPFSARGGHGLVVFDPAGSSNLTADVNRVRLGSGSSVLLLGGETQSYLPLNDVWSFSGTSWSSQSALPLYWTPGSVAATYPAGSPYVLASGNSSATQSGTISRSQSYSCTSSGCNSPGTASFSSRRFAAIATFQGALVMYGGLLDNGTITNEVWYSPSSTPGVWSPGLPTNTSMTAITAFPALAGHSMVEFNGNLLVIGGTTSTSTLSSSTCSTAVWSYSPVTKRWSRLASAPGFSARWRHSVTVFADRVRLFLHSLSSPCSSLIPVCLTHSYGSPVVGHAKVGSIHLHVIYSHLLMVSTGNLTLHRSHLGRRDIPTRQSLSRMLCGSSVVAIHQILSSRICTQ